MWLGRNICKNMLLIRMNRVRLTSVVLLLCLLRLFSFCGRLDDLLGDGSVGTGQVAIEQVMRIYQESNVSEAFIFFTDPHLLSGDNRFTQATKNKLNSSFKLVKEIYEKLHMDFCLCGGDWLNQRDTQEMAKEKLLYADKLMKTTFSRYYKIMGNHDTNYQGYVSISDDERGDLPRSFVDSEYFMETGSAYYSFEGQKTIFYILDSGLDWEMAMDEYRWEQLLWLAEQLLVNNNEHNVIGIHMFYNVDEMTPMSELLVQLCETYNEKGVIDLGKKTFDYSETKGKIHLILSGHNHKDSLTYEGRNNSIPVIRTCNYTINDTQSFDLFLIDYENELLNIVRVGIGDNRVIRFN